MNLADCRRILIYGGSFDPPHRAHVQLPELARRELQADIVAYVPAGRAPHKLDRVQTDPHHRLAMLRLALHDAPRVTILTDEIDRSGRGEPSYTVDTLEVLRDRLGAGPELRLLVGADQLRIFGSWRRADRIVALAEPVVMLRPPDTVETLLADVPPDQREAWRSRIISLPPLDIGSTELRQRLAAGDDCPDWIAPAVAAYIRRHGLYTPRGRPGEAGLPSAT